MSQPQKVNAIKTQTAVILGSVSMERYKNKINVDVRLIHRDGKIIIDFSSKIQALRLDPDGARIVAEGLLASARKLEQEMKKPGPANGD